MLMETPNQAKGRTGKCAEREKNSAPGIKELLRNGPKFEMTIPRRRKRRRRRAV